MIFPTTERNQVKEIPAKRARRPLVYPALGHQKMEMRVKIDGVSECLDDGEKAGFERRVRYGLKIEEKRPLSPAAKIAQELALKLEDHLTVRDIQKKRLPHPLAPLLKTFGMTRGTETSRFT